jgi:hypothetical protein
VGIRTDGIRCVDDLRQRSIVDKSCGCWRWRQQCVDGSARIYLVAGGKRQKVSGRRAALILSGHVIPEGHEAFARECCRYDDCVNPAHARSGTRRESRQYQASRGTFSAPHCYAHLHKFSAARRKLTPEQRVEVAVSREPAKQIAARLGVSPDLVWKLRLRKSKPRVVRSVFEWRPA